MEKIKNSIFFKIIKKVKLRTLILLIILFSFNSYAWIIFATKVSGEFSAKVSAWNVKFQAGEEEITTQVEFKVERIYPGMEPQTKTVTAYNTGEMKADLSYKIKSLSVLGTEYNVSEEMTEEDIIDIIETEFPFKLEFIIDNSNLNAEDGSANFVITLSWPFESGNDELDTQWGNKAYEFNDNYPDESSIKIIIELRAAQQAAQ